MAYDPVRHHRRSLRLPGYDYTQAGGYFVTLCSRERACVFGEVRAGRMEAGPMGRVVEAAWRSLGERYAHVRLGVWCLMPNHLHALLTLVGEADVGPTGCAEVRAKRKPLGQVVGAFKTFSTNQVKAVVGAEHVPVWQRDFYERIVRDGRELAAIERYICENPLRWEGDRYHPLCSTPEEPTEEEPWRV